MISIIVGKNKINYKEVQNRVALEAGLNINCPAAVAFLSYLRLIDKHAETITASKVLNSLAEKPEHRLLDEIIHICIKRIIEDEIFDVSMTSFNVNNGCLTIKKSAFPLQYAAIRNLFTSLGVFAKDADNNICVINSYDDVWESALENIRKKITLTQLLKQQERQRKIGLEAEEFVLQMEKQRVSERAYKIKRISDIDVAAGYDIVSFKSRDSVVYDRFIEVKCYVGQPHFFWSENEYDVAKIKGDKYVLCLVDYSKINCEGYIPEYIINPSQKLFEENQWLVNASTYLVQKI